jgi:membrane associated rhomboid family serine protease
MAQCVTCGAETPREQMYGAPDELRCRTCAQKSYAPFEAPRRTPQLKVHAPVTVAVSVAAIAATLIYGSNPANAVRYLIADPPAVWRGEVWRLFTTVFPHVNLMHLVFNLYWLWRFGQVVEAWMGSVRYAGFIVLVAVGPLAADFLVSQGGIGLSGVGYALFGLLYALRRDKAFAAEQMQPQVVQLFVGWFFLCIVLTYTKVMPVANVAHGAGAVLGWLVGRSLLLGQKVYLLSGLSMLVVTLVLATQYMPWNGNYAWYRGAQFASRAKYDRALYWYRKAVQAHPDNKELSAYLRWLEKVVKEHRIHEAPATE